MAPRPNVARAAKAFEDFTGAKASKVRSRPLDSRDVVGWKMGPAVGVAYEATRDGETQRYFHEFKKAARPDLIASDDGRKLYFSGGRYKVTDRGIEDMPQLFVVNPSSRRKKARPAKGTTMARRRRRTTTHRRRRARSQVAIFRANPVRRRRRRHTAVRRFARNPSRRRRSVAVRRFRRNPSLRRSAGGAINFGKMLMPAAGIGLGAVGSEIIMGYLPIPASFKTGVARHVTKGAVGVAAGLVLGKLFRQRRLGNYFALGAVAIAVHDAVKEMIAARAPGIHMGQYRGPIRSSFAGMGYANPGQVARLGQYTAAPASSFAGASTQHGVGGETSYVV